MPVSIVPISDLLSRRSKITKTTEWTELEQVLAKGLQKDSAVKITFSPETVQLFKNDVKKTAVAFVMRLRKQYGNKYRIRLVAKTEVQILNQKEK